MAGLPRSPHKTNWNKYEDAMNNVVRKEVCRVFLWLYQGGPKYVGDYLEEIPGGKKGLNKDEKDMLIRKESPTEMDITFLYVLLQRTCNLAKASDPVWANPTTSDCFSLEHTLYLIKKERNKLSHEGHKRQAQEMPINELHQKLDYLRSLCATLLTEAARRCDRLNEIVALNDKMGIRLQEIRGVTSDEFIMMAKKEILKTARSKVTDEWYQQPLFRRRGLPVTLDDMLPVRAPGPGAPSFLLVTGEAGVGKTSFCRYLEECWLRPPDDSKDPLQSYQLVLRIRCRDVNTSDVVRLLQEELLPETAWWCSSVTLSEFLRTISILWVFDGFDEATEEATRLMSSLFRTQQRKNTLLVTSRPEYGRDFLRRYSTDRPHISVSLCGIDPLEAMQNIVQSGDYDEDTTRHAKILMGDFQKLDQSIQQELQNPLKLRLALQGWESLRTSTLNQVFDLSRLYVKITDTQIESVSESLSKGTLTKAEATRKVRKWFSFLCESAFSLVHCRQGFGYVIHEDIVRKLEDKCDDLGISSSQCLSTFLSCPFQVFFTGNTDYTFYHETQVHFLAALHVNSVMKENNDLHSNVLRLFNITTLQEHASEQPPLGHFLPVLLLLVSLTSGSASSDVITMLIKLLLNAMHVRYACLIWFEVAINASYESRIMRKIGQVFPDFWFIEEDTVEVARRMLEYSQPKSVVLVIFCNPEEVKELEPLVCHLASLPVDMYIDMKLQAMAFSGTDAADKYLQIICRDESSCKVREFYGHLNDEGLLRHPNISDYCRYLSVRVESIHWLENFCECVKGFKCLQEIHVMIAMEYIPSTSAKLQATKINLYLPCMTDETAIHTAKFIARLCKSYFGLAVFPKISCHGMVTFLQYLEIEDIAVNQLLLCYGIEDDRFACVNFKSLPLEYPVEHFVKEWKKYILLAFIERFRDSRRSAL